MFEIIPNWHPILVHFTVSTLSLASIFYLVSYITRSHPQQASIRMFAEWNLWLGSCFIILTAITGWLAYNSVAHDTPSHEAMTDHRNWALATVTIFLAIAGWLYARRRSVSTIGTGLMALILIAFVLLVSTAWRGGEAVYRYGLGVMSLPNVEKGSDGHDHAHAGENDHSDIMKNTNTSMDTMPETTNAPNQQNGNGHENHQH